MSAAPGDTVTYSRPSLTQTTRNMPKGSSGSAATLIRTTPILRHSLRPCTASQRSGAAGHRPVSGRDPGSSAEGYEVSIALAIFAYDRRDDGALQSAGTGAMWIQARRPAAP